jgi:RND family efflux transporter MFP subunit
VATQRPAYSVPLSDFVAALLAEREVTPRARITAQHVTELIPGCSCIVYVVPDQENPSWEMKAVSGEVTLDEPSFAVDAGTLGAVWAKREAISYSASSLPREEYAHLHVRRSVSTLSYLPCMLDDVMIGCIEVVTLESQISEEDLSAVNDLTPYVSIAISTGMAYENERNTNLESISRLTQLYDLEKVFAATLELNDLMPTICTKVQQLFNSQAVNLWMVEGDDVVLMEQAGVDPTASVGTRQAGGEGIAADIANKGEALLFEDPEQDDLKKRNASVEEGGVFTLIASPVAYEQSLVGVLEVVNKLDGTPFDEDELFTIMQVSEVAASALHNASLLQAERKVEILQTLVQVSQQITSTLNLDRVLEAIVNGPQAVIPYERATLALEDRGKFQVRAISGMTQINPQEPDVRRLGEILRWVAGIDQEMYIKQVDGEIDDERAETREKFLKYFEESGVRAFYALPLTDDQGKLGILSLESTDPEFLTEAHLEMLKVLAGQATVALRNASLYREVPFIGVLEPILQKKQKFMAQSKKRRSMSIGIAVAVVLFLVFFPIPMRLDGDAVVAPAHTVHIQPREDGVISSVLVREGQQVAKGSVVAKMEDWEERSGLASAEAKYQAAIAEMNRALAGNDGSLAGQKRAEADYWTGEVSRARERLDQTQLRSPIDGVIATPHIENLAGEHVTAGQELFDILDSRSAVVDVAIPEPDLVLLQAGTNAGVKLEGFPTRTFRGRVAIVSPRSHADKDSRFFYARVEVPNLDGSIRPGMQGRGKIAAGWHPVGYVMFRDFGSWAWTKLWNLVGW